MTRLCLTHGGQLLEIDTTGARVCRYEVDGVSVVAGDEPHDALAYRSALLAPWPNRVAQGRWDWDATPLQLAVNEPSRDTALHGLVAYEAFRVEAHNSFSALLTHDLAPSPGYPFRLQVFARYRLTEGGLVCSLGTRNTGDRPAPAALGVHPYINAHGPVDDLMMRLPAESLVIGNSMWEVQGVQPVTATDLDFRQLRRIGDREIDACWTDLLRSSDGRVTSTVRFPDGSSVDVWGGSTCRWLVVYNGYLLPGEARRASITIEPCTAPANALRSGTDLAILKPGDELELIWGLRFHQANGLG